MRLLRLLMLAVLPAHLWAQTIGANKQPGVQTYTLSVRAQLVVETVVVKDKQGNTLPGLTAGDFTLTEDGIPQKIRICEHQVLPTTVTRRWRRKSPKACATRIAGCLRFTST